MTGEEIKQADAEMASEIVGMIGEAIGNPSIPPMNYNDVVRDFKAAIIQAVKLLRYEKGVGAQMALKPLELALRNAGLEEAGD